MLRTRQGGVSLIEALVTLAILSFGLLGLGMMQLQAMKFNTESYTRSQATWLAYDLMERMRLHRNSTATFTSSYNTDDCTLTSGTPANERDCWYLLVQDTLPSGVALITTPTAGTFQVDISWNERVARKTASAEAGVTRTQSWVFQP